MVPQRRPDRVRRSHDWPWAALLAGALLLTAAIGIAIVGGGVAADASAIGSEQPFAQQNDSTADSGVQDDSTNESDQTETDGDADSPDGDSANDADGDESAETEEANDGEAPEAEENATIDDVNASEDAEQDGDATTITECTAIEEPGTYELAADLEDQSGREVDVGAGMTKDVCIGIRASGVVLDGNGHVVGGTGASQSVGVQIFDTDGGSAADVTVRNLQVENWHNGIEIGFSSWYLLEDNPATATIEGVTTTSNGYHGVYVAAGSGSAFADVTASDNAEAGFGFLDAESVTITDSTAANNGEHGVALFEGVFDGEFADVAATDNGGAGVYLGRETSGNTFSNVQVTGNNGPGIQRVDGEQNEIRDATVENNG